ncbi:MAG TPA: NAD(P)-dependent oxidoreductase, partial [Streptosporangiaceae bacterium]|nr:NAD(P)-dependent oxidoreductase [Streptosporangiaceae bacterium]
MTLLLPNADGVADHVQRCLPGVPIIRYEDVDGANLDDVSFYCLPYMGDGASIALIARLPRLRVLQSLSSGVDDVLPAVPPGVILCNGRGLHHEEGTAELAVALILAGVRQLPMFVRQQAGAQWRHVRTESIEGKRVLLVGYGAIGAAIEQRLSPFGTSVVRVSRSARPGVAPFSQLADLAAAADIMVVCVALSESTRGLADARVLAALPAGALVVNVARGAIIDAPALTAELESGRLRAALDVTDPEPLPAQRPEWALPNVLITPHIGG